MTTIHAKHGRNSSPTPPTRRHECLAVSGDVGPGIHPQPFLFRSGRIADHQHQSGGHQTTQTLKFRTVGRPPVKGEDPPPSFTTRPLGKFRVAAGADISRLHSSKSHRKLVICDLEAAQFHRKSRLGRKTTPERGLRFEISNPGRSCASAG